MSISLKIRTFHHKIEQSSEQFIIIILDQL